MFVDFPDTKDNFSVFEGVTNFGRENINGISLIDYIYKTNDGV